MAMTPSDVSSYARVLAFRPALLPGGWGRGPPGPPGRMSSFPHRPRVSGGYLGPPPKAVVSERPAILVHKNAARPVWKRDFVRARTSPAPFWEMQGNAPVTNPRLYAGTSGPIAGRSTRRAPLTHINSSTTDAGCDKSASSHGGVEGERQAVGATDRLQVARCEFRLDLRVR